MGRQLTMDGDSTDFQLLFVDDEEGLLRYVSKNLGSMGYDVLTTPDWDEARALLKQSHVQPEVIFIEPVSNGNELNGELREICTEAGQIPVVVLSISRDPKSIVKAIRAGARDYLCKPFEIKQLHDTISALHDIRLNIEKTPTATQSKETELVFFSPQMEKIHHTVLQIADTRVPVLIQGETGVGKDLIARLIHQKSHLRDKPFVKVNCAAVPGELVESELFGFRKGAFTGAHTDRPGRFEFANGGTIFLDEIGEFSSSIQAKLLQVLQDGRFRRLGSNRETEVNVRVIAATNRKLEEALKDGTFRQDLYYRLNVVNLDVPPLRWRSEEIPLFCKHFMKKLSSQYNSDVTELPQELEKLFSRYHWPGNVRELENLIKRYLVLGDAESIQTELEGKMVREELDEINEIAESYLQENKANLDLKEVRKKATAVAEKSMIRKTLRQTHWNRWKAAKELKVSYKTLLTKISQYQIAPLS